MMGVPARFLSSSTAFSTTRALFVVENIRGVLRRLTTTQIGDGATASAVNYVSCRMP